ncbi:MAG: hypothetical protein HZB85_09075 [Deltaproteobacteria bacterium]|nr:hypothetical protein [Deltaproteobacteria bacterium]
MTKDNCGAGCAQDEGHEGHDFSAADFVRYEIDMFRTAYTAWEQYKDDGFLNNVFLEVLLVHFRALHSLLHKDGAVPNGAVGLREFFSSDVSLEDFMQSRCAGDNLAYLNAQDARAAVKLGPLTRERMDDMAEWDIHKIYELTDKSIEALMICAPETFPEPVHDECHDPECEDPGCAE